MLLYIYDYGFGWKFGNFKDKENSRDLDHDKIISLIVNITKNLSNAYKLSLFHQVPKLFHPNFSLIEKK